MRVKNGLVDQRYWVVSDCGWSGGPYTTQLIAKEIKERPPRRDGHEDYEQGTATMKTQAAYDNCLQNYRDAWNALEIIRLFIEENFGGMLSGEQIDLLYGVEPGHQAQAICEAIANHMGRPQPRDLRL